MVFYVFVVAVLNFCLGMAVATQLARRSGRLGASRLAAAPRAAELPAPEADRTEAIESAVPASELDSNAGGPSGEEDELAKLMAEEDASDQTEAGSDVDPELCTQGDRS